MRYFKLFFSFEALLILVLYAVAPQEIGSYLFYTGTVVCGLVALVITWNDKDDWLDNALKSVLTLALIAAFIYGAGFKLNLWGMETAGNADADNLATTFVNLGLIFAISAIMKFVIIRKRNG
ncbi:hypothetical protein CI789_23140 (plasmid) [Erwinia persicina]|uniref:hypothetical protein n=1 Tax=Erwinia persicina TaxID=55211 RepID=UPI000E50C462|nr:hypothetical protein [Erwinia persicina]AXU98098.1 hypothetical protein CI789_23140 [Erwinia persicina]